MIIIKIKRLGMKHHIKTKPKKLIIECLACSEEIYVGHNPIIGNIITCGSCDTMFEIIDLEPVLIDWPYFDDDYGVYGDDEGIYDEVDDKFGY
jgi:hypothetical protein